MLSCHGRFTTGKLQSVERRDSLLQIAETMRRDHVFSKVERQTDILGRSNVWKLVDLRREVFRDT